MQQAGDSRPVLMSLLHSLVRHNRVSEAAAYLRWAQAVGLLEAAVQERMSQVTSRAGRGDRPG